MTVVFHGFAPSVVFLAGLAGGMALSALIVLLSETAFPEFARENHALENAQLACLLAASVVQCWRARLLPRDATRECTIAVLLAFLCLACALRELDIDRLGDARYFEPLERALRLFTLAGLLGFLGTHLRQLRPLFHVRTMLRDPVVRFALSGVLLYCLSWPLDKKVFEVDDDYALVMEEWLELWACVSFLVAAWLPRSPGRPP